MTTTYFSPIRILCFTAIVILQSCSKNLDEFAINDMATNLSSYQIFEGNPTDLNPKSDYKLYELSSTLFTDHAEKQRLIKVPAGTSLSAIDDGLLDFPNGTIIVKTFFYYKDKRTPSKGKSLIETRLLIKKEEQWKVGTYRWNKAQTEATLITSSFDQTTNWIDQDGKANVIAYHIPSNLECKTCHLSFDQVVPIGPKTNNLNIEIYRNGFSQNQLTYLAEEGILNPVDISSFSTLPNYNNQDIDIDLRARAYLETNCAHCHSTGGFADDKKLRFSYETSLEDSQIIEYKSDIIAKMESGTMPKAGTTLLDEKGIELLRNFINTL